MNCQHCGIELTDVARGPGIEMWLHPDGQPCPKLPVLLGDEEFTRAEIAALLRVARAQIELEARRGRNG